MIRSMTGFGTASGTGSGRPLTAEVRSVNARGLQVVFKGPPSLSANEPEVRRLVARHVGRGRVEVSIRTGPREAASRRELDSNRVKELLSAAEELRARFGVKGDLDVASVIRAGSILREPVHEDLDEVGAEMLSLVSQALRSLVEMRDTEGARLEADLRERLAAILANVDQAECLAPQRLVRERERLRAAVAEVGGGELEPEQMARQIALIADRWDVGEELVRARSHVAAFEEFLATPVAEPVGKRLGFLVQELHREINTLGAKANDAQISYLVVAAKGEIERLREQVENIE